MTFVLHAFLGPDAPGTSNGELAADLRALFGDEEGFRLGWELLPFAEAPTLALRWGNWLTRVAYEEGEDMTQDYAYAREVVGASAPFDPSQVTRRVRVVFGTDDDRAYTNQIIRIMEFLERLPGAVVFDPRQGGIVT